MKKRLGSFVVVWALIMTSFIPIANAKEQSDVYQLELSRWGVYNDGTHSLETTNGINSALQWAKENGYKTFEIPDGTYLIAKGSKAADSKARINMVSDMDLVFNDQTVLQKEVNQWEIYSVLYVGPNVKNVKITGGTFLGDRDSHDYSQKGIDTAGTHEWGSGIEIAGAENVVVDGVKLEKFTGDGIIVTGTTVTGSMILETHLEKGGIDDNGKPVATDGKIRTNDRKVTHFDNQAYDTYNTIHFWLPQGIASGSKVNVYYYRKDGSFIKADKQVRFYSGESVIPDGADYFRAVFEASSTKGVKVNRMTVDISKNITIKNSDIGYNRRQGISLVGSDGVEIVNNHIHHTNGTAPQSGIDIEPGFFPGKNTIIKENTFTDNKIQIVLAYGENAIIEGNSFVQSIKGSVGVHAHKGFRGKVVVKDNTFNGSGLTLYSQNAIVDHNKFTNSEVKMLGGSIEFSNSILVDASLSVGNEENQKVNNVSIEHNGVRPGILYFGDKSIHLQDVNIKGNTNGQSIINGTGNNESIYNRLTVEDNNRQGTVLPAGTYNNCSFEAGGISINRKGKYILNHCSIRDKSNLLSVNNLYGKPDVTINHSVFELTENIGYGAAVYIVGAKNFKLFNSTVLAESNTTNTPLIKIGPYGNQKTTNVFGATIKGNVIKTKTAISGIDTSNSGTNAPAYQIEENSLSNAKLKLSSKDSNVENKLLTE
ncbi:right-handed parallel beta-helix repeat-containing protein [Peribacillus sp. JNUCC 23]